MFALGFAGSAWAAQVTALEVETHTVTVPQRTGDPGRDAFEQFEVTGTITNRSDRTLEMVSATLTFHDAAGKLLGVDSIGTAVKRDAGDASPGETVYADVHFVAPGQSVPFHFRRNLAAIGGDVASHQLTPRFGHDVDHPPVGLVVGLKDAVEGGERVLSGTVRNDGRGRCRAPAVVVAFLDQAGKIVDLDRIDATDDLKATLATGASLPFRGALSVTDADAWRAGAPIRTWVDCRPAY